MTIQGAQLVRRKPKDGAPGKPGTDGNGIASITTYFALTNKPHLARFADLAASEWRTTFPTTTLEKPYVWKCVLTKYTKQASVYSTPELVTTYHSGDNLNLIENAAFTNDNNMQAWSTISQYAPIKGSTAPTDKGHVDLDTTLQQHHAFVDQCRATEVTIYYKDMLAQVIHAPKQGIHKLTGGQWYTLSFWAKMSSPSPTATNDLLTYLHPTAVDTATPMIIDGNETPATQADANVGWKLTAEWTRHTVTFKTRATLPEADKQTLLFRLPPSPGLFNPRTVWLCMPKLEEGMFATGFVDTPSDLKGDSGITVRRSEWQLGVNYRNDTANGAQSADGHRYLDEVSVTNLATGKAEWFVARALHNGTTSTAANKPTTGGNNYWEPVNDMRPIHTSYADIMTAFIQFLQVNQLTITDNKGTVYGAFGGGDGMDYPLWFGGKTANEAVVKFGKKGDVWIGQNFRVVSGDVYVTGNLHVNSLFLKQGDLTTKGNKKYLNLDNYTGNYFVLPNNENVYLPSPKGYEGMQLTVFLGQSLNSGYSALSSEQGIFIPYYMMENHTGKFITNSMSVTCLKSLDGLTSVTLVAAKAYGVQNALVWAVTAHQGIIALSDGPTPEAAYTNTIRKALLPDGRLIDYVL
nr:MAG TPA: hypothetical protein [Crassvirales sp.]